MSSDAADLVLRIIFFMCVAAMLSMPIYQVARWLWKKYRGED